jgi:SET domain-containing protein
MDARLVETGIGVRFDECRHCCHDLRERLELFDGFEQLESVPWLARLVQSPGSRRLPARHFRTESEARGRGVFAPARCGAGTVGLLPKK